MNALTVSGSNIYISGYFYSVAPAFGNTVLANAGTVASTHGMTTNDVFVAKLTDAGSTANFAWAQQAGGAGFDNSLAIAASRTGLYVSGVIAPPARFGPQTITGPAGVQSGYMGSINDLALATAATATLPGLRFHPNPSHATATVQLPPVPGVATAALTFTDALGRVVRAVILPLPTSGLHQSLDITGLAPGLYAVRVQVGNAAATSKLLVE